MARPVDSSLEYFSLDVDFFDDPKILMIEEQFGVKGGYVATRLLCMIYRNGYFIEWNDDMALVIAKRVGNGISHTCVIDIVNALVKRSFFDKTLFNRCAILTSRGIQKRWLKVVTDAKRKAKLNPDYDLTSEINSVIPVVSSPIIQEETPSKQELTTAITEETTHSIVKESIVKERKGEQKKEETGAPNFLLNSNLFSQPVIPTEESVQMFFRQQGGTEEMAQKFYATHAATNWYYRGSPIKDFTKLAASYITTWRQNENKNGSSKHTTNLVQPVPAGSRGKL